MRHSKLSNQALELSRLTRDLSRCCQAKEEQIFKKSGLSCAEGRVMLCIADFGLASASAVAEKLSLSKGRLSPLIDSLVRKGFLTRTESATDRRSNELAITESGYQVSRAVVEYQLSFHEDLLRRFKTEDRTQLLSTLDHLHAAMDDLRSQLSLTE